MDDRGREPRERSESMSSEMFEEYEMDLTSMLQEITKSLTVAIPRLTGGVFFASVAHPLLWAFARGGLLC
jgi:hypothetical protein